MITIKILSFNGQPPGQPVQSDFDEMGGTIGRADGNALVLPDPERYVSRHHATIAYRAGHYVIRDLSSASPVHVNGQPLGNGREGVLADGDEIRIGGYTLRVLGDMPNPAKAQPPPVAAPAGVQPAAPRDDPLAMFGQSGADPFADLPTPGTPAPATRNPAGSDRDRNARPGARETIPAGFDPFADVMAPLPSAQSLDEPANPARLPDDFNLGLAPASSQNIDQLFGLNAGQSADPFAVGHPLGDPGNRTDRSSSLDPLVAMGAVPAPLPIPETQRDDAMEIRAAFIPPSVSFTGVQPEPEPVPVAQPRSAAAPQDRSSMLFSWDAPEHLTADGEFKTVIVASAPQAAPAPVAPRQQEAPPASISQTDHVVPPTQAPSQPQAAVPGPGFASEDELLHAFLVGAGVPDLDMRGPLSPHMMTTIGQLLRTSTQGTLDLLLARALIKREVRADVTMIVARENNPLKFSPNVEVALSHLLAPRGQGFMSPVAAVKDACDDLRAHQFGFMAGMRAALDGVLRRFDPAQLEQRLSDKSIVDAMLPINRKAKLWSLFAELYADITREAQDDFHALFGKEFLRAYESQLDLLEKNGHDVSPSEKQ